MVVAAFGLGCTLGAEPASVVGLAIALTSSEARNRTRWLDRERCRWADDVVLAASMFVPASAYLAGVFVDQGAVASYALGQVWAAPLVMWGLNKLDLGPSAQWAGSILGCWALPALLNGGAA